MGDSNEEMEDYLLANNNKFRLIGAMMITNMSDTTGEYALQLIFNMPHALPIILNTFDNIFINYRAKTTFNDTNHYEISTYSKPWKSYDSFEFGSMFVDLLFLGLVIFAYSLVPSSYAVTLIRERETGVKQLLLISGTSKLSYWFANLIWDTIMTIPTILLTCLIFYIGDKSIFGGSSFALSILILLLYVIDSTLLCYLLSMLWDKHIRAQGKF